MIKWVRRFRLPTNVLPFVIFLLISVVYSLFIFNKIPKDSFLLAHDHATWVSKEHLSSSSFILSQMNSGLAMPVQLVTSFTGRLLHKLLYSLGLEIRSIQLIICIMSLFLLQALSFLGISKVYRYVSKKENIVDVLLVTFYYCFSPLVIIFMSTGNFWNLNFLISYSLLPLLVYVVFTFFSVGDPKLVDLVVIGVLLYLVLLYVPFIVPVALILLLLVTSYFGMKKVASIGIHNYLAILLLLLVLHAPIVHAYYVSSIESYRGVINDALIDSTAKLLRGGVMNMMLNKFSWAIYTVWKPRSILPFYSYYKSILFVLMSLSVYYVLIIFNFFGLKKNKFLGSFTIVLLVSLFFAKGPQNPFGFIYNFIINKIPLMQVIRSPDNKLSLGIVFSITMLFVLVLNELKGVHKLIFRVYLVVAILIYSYPVVTGEAIIGRNNSLYSGDFITKIYPEHKAVADLLNSQPGHYGVLIYPPSTFSVTVEDNNSLFIGYDTIGPELRYPVYYTSLKTLTEPYVQDVLEDIYYDFSVDKLTKISVGYVVIRKDMYDKDWLYKANNARLEMNLESGFTKLIDNDVVEVYRVPDNISRQTINLECDDDGGILSYDYVSPIRYDILLSNIKSSCKVEFMGLHSNSWRFFALPIDGKISLSTLPSIVTFNKISEHFPNEWVLNPHDLERIPFSLVNERDGSISLRLVMYYVPQFYYYVFLALSSIVLLVCLIYIALNYRESKLLKFLTNSF